MKLVNMVKKVNVWEGGGGTPGQNTPFAVHNEKIHNHLPETATNSVEIQSLARKNKHFHIYQIQLRFSHLNQHSVTLLGIHMRHVAYKREE